MNRAHIHCRLGAALATAAPCSVPGQPWRKFYSETTGEYYDIKGVHSDYPPFNNVRDKSQPFKDAYDPANNEAWVNKQLAKQIEKR
ncbi:hypothetical protein ABZ826_28895 [Streptomyces sp. NPDC047515]|uniref:hypothetical protein n=1 Tax=Streptomyces sp. NPDC047515 TaxID=3155380 RepID=UPI003402027B